MRLNKYLAACGVSSRREADELIREGLVTINGQKIDTPGYQLAEGDWVKLNGKTVKPKPPVYYAYYKPKNMITTMSDPEGRRCVGEVVARLVSGVGPVGRLDWLSEGLLFLSNDGDWGQQIQHPRFHLLKIYHVKIRGSLDPKELGRLRRGIKIDGMFMKMETLKPVSKTKAGHSWWEITLSEGKTRQIRKMMKAVGHPVQKLRRISVGPVKLGKMKSGDLRELTQKELDAIRKEIIKGGANEGT